MNTYPQPSGGSVPPPVPARSAGHWLISLSYRVGRCPGHAIRVSGHAVSSSGGQVPPRVRAAVQQGEHQAASNQETAAPRRQAREHELVCPVAAPPAAFRAIPATSRITTRTGAPRGPRGLFAVTCSHRGGRAGDLPDLRGRGRGGVRAARCRLPGGDAGRLPALARGRGGDVRRDRDDDGRRLFSIPALIAGVATTKFGLHSTALVYSASLAALVAVAAGILPFGPSGQPARAAPASRAVMPPGPCTGPPCPQATDPSDGSPATTAKPST